MSEPTYPAYVGDVVAQTPPTPPARGWVLPLLAGACAVGLLVLSMLLMPVENESGPLSCGDVFQAFDYDRADAVRDGRILTGHPARTLTPATWIVSGCHAAARTRTLKASVAGVAGLAGLGFVWWLSRRLKSHSA